jgi:Fe-S oxidoreductase
MATYKSEFLHHHYKHRIRPVTHYSLGWLPLIARLAGTAPRVINALAQNSAIHPILTAVGGITMQRAVPRFARAGAARKQLLPHLAPHEHADIVLFTDTFTRAFRPELMGSAAHVLSDSGLGISNVQGACCGLTWITTGQLSVAKKVLQRTARILDKTGDGPIVVLEPSCAAALRKDLPELVESDPARRVATRVIPFAEMINRRLDAGWKPPPVPQSVMLQQHCHEYAVFGSSLQQKVMTRLGITTIDSSTGCCGLAGNFGFEESHYDISMSVADLSLTGKLRTASARQAIAADGFSCQTQISHLNLDDNPPPVHLAQMLEAGLTNTVAQQDRGKPER